MDATLAYWPCNAVYKRSRGRKNVLVYAMKTGLNSEWLLLGDDNNVAPPPTLPPCGPTVHEVALEKRLDTLAGKQWHRRHQLVDGGKLLNSVIPPPLPPLPQQSLLSLQSVEVWD
jgi:hypothetical protein